MSAAAPPAAAPDRTAPAVPGAGRSAGIVQPRERAAWLPLAAAAAAVVALGPLLGVIGARLWNTSYYSHAPFYLAALAGLAWWRATREGDGVREPGTTWAAAAAWTAVLLLAAASAWIWTPWGGLVAALLALAAGAYTWGGWGLLGRVGGCWAGAWLVVPPPMRLDEWTVLQLQGVATRWASAGLDLIGQRHLVAGNTVEMPGRSYFVEEACSGVNGLMAALAAVSLYMVWNRRGLLRSLVLLAVTAGWVLVCNAVRVTAVVVLEDRFGLPVASGVGHDVLGAITFASALALTASTDRLLLFFAPAHSLSLARLTAIWRPAAEGEDVYGEAPAVRRGPPPARRSVWAFAAAGFVAVAGLEAVVLVGWEASVAAPVKVGDLDALKRVPEAALPDEWDGWRKVNFGVVERDRSDLMGALSHVWEYRKGPTTAMISMDGPFPDGWHDLNVCYDVNGWNCGEATPAGGLADGATTAIALEKPAGRRGYVLFSAHALEDDETVSAAAPASLGGAVVGRMGLGEWLAEFAGDAGARPGSGEPVYQVQVLTHAYRDIDDRERASVAALFEEMRGRLTAWRPPAG